MPLWAAKVTGLRRLGPNWGAQVGPSGCLEPAGAGVSCGRGMHGTCVPMKVTDPPAGTQPGWFTKAQAAGEGRRRRSEFYAVCSGMNSYSAPASLAVDPSSPATADLGFCGTRWDCRL